ncbi:hypothetical protein ACMGDK_11540 [Chryseobacterium sp. DT-3]|uniref:hypothetical protein n=1 Tax=Chryseobacterium sp. DT-3 TaxID=3396164 RepID=UPI003F1B5CEF
MNALNLQIPQGYEIDFEKSNLRIGTIQLRILDEKVSELPNDFNSFSQSLKDNLKCNLTEKYADKLIVLDILLNLRDLYDSKCMLCQNYCIMFTSGELISSKCSGSSSFIFKFRSKEKIDLFISNFREQLNYIKEFL